MQPGRVVGQKAVTDLEGVGAVEAVVRVVATVEAARAHRAGATVGAPRSGGKIGTRSGCSASSPVARHVGVAWDAPRTCS